MDYADGDDYAGDDDMGQGETDVMGAIARRVAGRRPQQRGAQRVRLPAKGEWQNDTRLRSAMGTGFGIWTAADATDKVLQVEPQEDFQGNRLVIDVVEAGGVSAGLSLVRRIEVGTMPQSPSVDQPMPSAMFRADVTYADLDFQLARAATKMTTTMGITAAPGGAVTLTASGGFYGRWTR